MGGGGRTTPPPPVAHPQDFVPPFSNFVPPFNKPMQSVRDRDRPITHPPLGLGMWMTSHGQCPGGGGMSKRGGGVFQFFGGRMTSRGQCPRGCACECPRVGAFFKLMTSRGQCPRGGGAPGVPPIQVQTPPPTWLAGYGPGYGI